MVSKALASFHHGDLANAETYLEVHGTNKPILTVLISHF